MKFSVLQKDLLEALLTIQGVVPTRSTAPILENILIEAKDNVLKLTGTDLEVSITTEAKASSVSDQGAIALPARVITEMIRSLPDIEIQFDLEENNRVKIITNQGKYQIAGIPKDNFPEMPSFSQEKRIEVENSLLKRMFSKTIFAVSSEELRPALMGVFIQIMGDEFRMVATDGHRLSKIIDKSFRYDGEATRMIVPPKAVQIALKNLAEEGKTTLIMEENGLAFIFDSTVLYTRLVEGEYPDYERVIPRDNDKQLIVDKAQLIASVKRVSLFSSALTHQVRFSISSGKLEICSEDVDIGGEAREEISADYSADAMEIGYNAQYLIDIMKHIDSDEVMFHLNNPVRAALITPVTQEENESFLMLIMPIKLSA
jgi:DNA polymerase-3 subunit beta